MKIANTVYLLNQHLAGINKKDGFPTVRLGTMIHHVRKNKSIHSSYKALRDGCHPDERMLWKHAEVIGGVSKSVIDRGIITTGVN